MSEVLEASGSKTSSEQRTIIRWMALAGIIFAIGLQRGVKLGRFWTKIGPALLVGVGIAMLLSGFPIEDVHYGAPIPSTAGFISSPSTCSSLRQRWLASSCGCV